MKRDIRINYSVLEEIRDQIKQYKNAIETIQEVLNTVNNRLEENEGQAVNQLKGNYDEIKGDLEGCHEEVDDLYTIFDGYISDMQDIIRPIDTKSIMQVDRNDIWWNMQYVFEACQAVEHLRFNIGTYISLPNFFKSDEEKANEDINERKIEEIWDDINRCAELLNTNIADLQSKYDNKIIPYENKDDEYASKAGGLYSKYTSTWEYVKEKTKEGIIDTVDTVKGLLKSVADLVVGAFGLIKGIGIYAAAGVATNIKEVTGDVPDWMQYCIDKSEEYDKTILEVLKDPGLIIEGLSQSVSDTYEEKGIAYASGYVAGEVVQTILISKGIDKLKGVSKVDEAITKVDDLSKTAEDIGGIAGNASKGELDRIYSVIDDIRNGKISLEFDERTASRMTEDVGPYHNIPESLNIDIISNEPYVIRANGRAEFLTKGSINGTEGVFQITLEDNVIKHRAFIPKSDWTRFSNRWNLPKWDSLD